MGMAFALPSSPWACGVAAAQDAAQRLPAAGNARAYSSAVLVCTALPHVLNCLFLNPQVSLAFLFQFPLRPADGGRNEVPACAGAEWVVGTVRRSGTAQLRRTLLDVLHVGTVLNRPSRWVCFAHSHTPYSTCGSPAAAHLPAGAVHQQAPSLVRHNRGGTCFWLQLVQHHCGRFAEGSLSSLGCSASLWDAWDSSPRRAVGAVGFPSALPEPLCALCHVTAVPSRALFGSRIPAAARFAGNVETPFIFGGFLVDFLYVL